MDMVGSRARRFADPDAPNDPEVEAAFAAVPPTMVAEILDGELHTMPRPRPRHARTATRLVRRLGPFDDDPGEPGGWVLLLEPELHLGPKPDKVVPDIAGWQRDRLPESVFDDDAPGHLEIAPDWVCEVISERTERTDRSKKMRIYRRERVGWVWLVNPVQRTVEAYRHEGGNWTLLDTHEGDALVRIPPFDAIELPLAVLWAR
jgi:Uma2 family endonuclease